MRVPEPTIIKMSEGEARLRTITERLYSHSNRIVATNLDHSIEVFAQKFWRAEDEETANAHVTYCEELTYLYGVAPASAIGHLVGYNQY